MSESELMNYGFRIFWGLVMGGFVAGSLRGSWNAENGRRGYLLRERSDTVVWLDPLVFPVLCAVYLGVILYVLSFRGEILIGFFIVSVTDMFLFISVYFTVLLLLLPVLRRYYTARTCATLWLIPVFLFYQPQSIYSLNALPPVLRLYIPEKIVTAAFFVWIIGFAGIFTVQVISHLHFAKNLRNHSRPVENPLLLEKWNDVQKKVDYTLPVELRYCSQIRSPLSVGMRKKHQITYLPDRLFTDEEAELIFCHELHHIQRKDTHTKFFLRFCNALGWIHPFIWLAVKQAEDDLELSCDEIVLKNADADMRKKYAELLLTVAGDSRGYSTCLSASAKTLRYRLKAVAPGKSKKLGICLLFSIMFLSVLCAGRTALVTERGGIAAMTDIDMSEMINVNVRFSGNEDTLPMKDTGELSEYLSSLEVERSMSVYEGGYDDDGPVLDGNIGEDDIWFSLTDTYFIVYNLESGHREQYFLRAPADWEYIRSLV